MKASVLIQYLIKTSSWNPAMRRRTARRKAASAMEWARRRRSRRLTPSAKRERRHGMATSRADRMRNRFGLHTHA